MTVMQRVFWRIAVPGNLLWILLWAFNLPGALCICLFMLPFTAIGLYDLFRSPHTLNRLYPVVAYLRYALEYIRPEIRQYFIASNTDERPFNREMRNLVYSRAKGQQDTLAFGSELDMLETGFMSLQHSILPVEAKEDSARVIVGNEQCSKPYSASRLNVSALSFGALSANAIKALNIGAKLGDFAHNTGEGGISIYHQQGGHLIWQIGTGYFGCRSDEGMFDPKQFEQKAAADAIKMIEIKISQGAKPSHGGILPAVKITQEIAAIRGVSTEEDCISPSRHSAFSTPIGLLEFVQQLRQLSTGKPIGFKLCIGKPGEFMAICKAMLETGIYPDFITIDGGEGGTGAAPMEFTNRLGMLCIEATHFVHNSLVGVGLRDKVKIISSGKTASGYEVLEKIAVGADMVNAARTMMFALGCVQSLTCNTNKCPTGVATQDPARSRALDVKLKSVRVYNYHKATVKSFWDLLGALGLDSPELLSPEHLFQRMDDGTSKSFADINPSLEKGQLLTNDAPDQFLKPWRLASSQHF